MFLHVQIGYYMAIWHITFIASMVEPTSSGHPSKKQDNDILYKRKPFHVVFQKSLQRQQDVTKPGRAISRAEKIRMYQSDAAAPETEYEQMFNLFMQKHQPKNKRSKRLQDCDKDCKFGFETDVEGKQLCKCMEPCKGVMCFGGSECVPERSCVLDHCSYKGVCKAATKNVCSLPKPRHTFMCDKLTRRYYYDERKGRCRRFWGCKEITGNSFGTKRECKKSCYNKERRRDKKKKQRRYKNKGERNEISNHIPTLESHVQKPAILPESGEISNHIEAHIRPQYSSKVPTDVMGLNQLSRCPDENPYVNCPFDPCAGCSNPDILCFTSFCGQCQAIYINLKSGKASDKFAPIC